MSSTKSSVLMLSWEYPPRVVGGISSHVYDLSRALTRRGVNVHVVTCDFPDAPDYEEADGVHVYRFDSYNIPAYDFLSWVFAMNKSMLQRATDVMDANDGRIDLIHAHDWLVAQAAFELKDRYEKPLVSTIHSTEAGRRGGIRSDYERTINEIEKQLVQQSWKVLCCSNYMADQVSKTFGADRSRVNVIRNGVDTSRFDVKINYELVKQRYALPNEKLILFVGRLVHEKGVHVLIGAVPKVLATYTNVKFVIVGEGGMKESLLSETWNFGVSHKVFFTGFVDRKTLITLYKVSDLAVFPSLYEPFGITALEAMAAQVPVVVSDVGGLSEIVEHDKTGVKIYPNNSDSLAWGVVKVLTNPNYADSLRQNAYRKIVEEYNWDKIAGEVVEIYRQTLALAPPKPVEMPKIQFPLQKFEKYTSEFRALLYMHSIGAVRRETAISIGDIVKVLDVNYAKLRRLLSMLIILGYVLSFKDNRGRMRYYLTGTGIIKVCSLFS